MKKFFVAHSQYNNDKNKIEKTTKIVLATKNATSTVNALPSTNSVFCQAWYIDRFKKKYKINK
jgi:hypothetical protein